MLVTQAGDLDSLRKDYSNCMVDVTIEHLDKKTGTRAFKKAAQGACLEKRSAYIEALAKDEVAYGSTPEEAQEYAREEADSVMNAMVNGYDDMQQSNTRPSKET
ncbi:MAG: hypothetical protein AAFX04_06250 [Pseudomonadota bacterium]